MINWNCNEIDRACTHCSLVCDFLDGISCFATIIQYKLGRYLAAVHRFCCCYIIVKYKISIISMKHSNFKKFLKFYDLQHMWWNKNANLSQNLHNEWNSVINWNWQALLNCNLASKLILQQALESLLSIAAIS